MSGQVAPEAPGLDNDEVDVFQCVKPFSHSTHHGSIVKASILAVVPSDNTGSQRARFVAPSGSVGLFTNRT